VKTITLTTREFQNFKKLASFFFDICWKEGFVHVTANIEELDRLGY